MKRHASPTRRVAALLAMSSLAACSGVGNSSNPIPARAPIATSSAPASASSKTRATFVVHWPSAAQAAAASRRRNTISPSTQSISVTVNGGSPTVVNKPKLTGSPSTTSISIYAPPGDDGFTFTAWDQLDASGAVLDQSTVNQIILADANNTVSVALDGVCAALVPTLTQTGIYVQYTNATVPLSTGSRTVLKSARMIGNFPKIFQFTRVDADGNTILTSAGSAPIVVTESGSTQHVSIVPVATGASNLTFTFTPILAEPDGTSTTITAASPTCGNGTSTLPNSFTLSTAAEVIVADAKTGLFAFDQDGTPLATLATHAMVPSVGGVAYNSKSNDLVTVEPNTSGSGGSLAYQIFSLTGSVLGSGTFTPQDTPVDDDAQYETPENIVYDPASNEFYLALAEDVHTDPAPPTITDGAIEEYSISGSTATYIKAITFGTADPSAFAVFPNGNFAVNDESETETYVFTDALSSVTSVSLKIDTFAFDTNRGNIFATENGGNDGTILSQSLGTVNTFTYPVPAGGLNESSVYSPGNDELYLFDNAGNAAGLTGSTAYAGGTTTSNLPYGAFPGLSQPNQALVFP